MLPENSPQSPSQNGKPRDYLWLNLRELPYFRALMRAIEASFYPQLNLPHPILDVGCGDGHFATVAFNHRIDVGLDPGSDPLHEAIQRDGYHYLVQADGAGMPFPSGYFASAFSNSVLEHIPQVEQVLAEIWRVLKPGAPFAFCGPNNRFLTELSIGRTLDKIKLHALSNFYRGFFNRISRHYHSDSPEVWEKRLVETGFHLERWWHYFSPEALRVIEWGHYFGLPALISKKLTGRWILAPSRWNLWLPEHFTRSFYQQGGICENGVCTFYIARRV